MQHKALVIGLSLALASTMALAAPTAVTVNGKTISAQAQEKIIQQIVKNGQKRTPELEMQVRNQLIQKEVLLQEANRKKLANRPEVRDAINNARDSVLINALISDFAKKNPVKDADVKKFYEEQKKAYGDREYKISVITVRTEADAKKVIDDLKDGDKFADVAKKYSIQNGYSDPEQIQAAAQVHHDAMELGMLMTQTLLDMGVPAASVSPGTCLQATYSTT